MKPEVENKLLEIAHAWAKFSKIPLTSILDIAVTGGNANFNYTKYSDIDLHIIIDKQTLLPNSQWDSSETSIIDDFLKSKKQLWALKHDIKINGYPVELYAQGTNELYHDNQGVYSVKYHKWIAKPLRGSYNFIIDRELKHKVDMWEKRIDDAIQKGAPIEEIELMRKRLSEMRKASLEKGGEFSQENLVFKSLRNSGHLKSLSNYQLHTFDKTLSL